MPKPLKGPNLARSVPKPLKGPSLARFVPKPLKVPSLARSVPKAFKLGQQVHHFTSFYIVLTLLIDQLTFIVSLF